MLHQSIFIQTFLLQISNVFGCVSVANPSTPRLETVESCPSCDVTILSGTSFTPTTTETPGVAYFLRGVHPISWCDTAQINCLAADGQSLNVKAQITSAGQTTVLASGCGEAHSEANVLECNDNNQWTFRGTTDFIVTCRTELQNTCEP